MKRLVFFLSVFALNKVFANISGSNTGFPTCGSPYNSQGLALGGKEFSRGELRWIVALMHEKTDSEPVYICGGTLITAKHILTGEVFRF